MSSRKNPETIPSRGLFAIYFRLLRTYARPYWFKISLGVLSGLIIGGALGAGLRVMDIGLNVFDTGIRNRQNITRSTTPETPAGPAAETIPAMAAPAEPASPPAATEPAAEAPKVARRGNRLLDRVNQVFVWAGLDIRVSSEEALTLPVIFTLLVIVFFFFVVQALGNLLNKYCLRWVGARMVADMRASLFNHFQQQSIRFFDCNDVGRLVSRCTNDTKAIEQVISNSLPELIIAPIFILVSGQFIIAKTREANLQLAGLAVLLLLPLCIAPIIMLSKLLKRYERRILGRIEEVSSRMIESFSGIRVVKAFNQESLEKQRFHSVNENFFKACRKAIVADIMIHPTMQVSTIALAAAFVLVCYHYNISFGTLAIIGFAAQQVYKPVKELVKLNASLQRCAAAAERIFDMLDTNTALPLPPKPVRLASFNHEIRFEQVNFGYAGPDQPVLQDINLRIRRGMLVAVVGQTGSGKSTLANLLARFYDPQQGRISIDGHDIKTIDTHDLRSLIGIVSQDTFLFNDSIADNIRYGRQNATAAEIEAAARQANASEFIEATPEGYGRKVGERGNLLSGGQKQRISIARTILKNPPILILDEATSALDTATERLVQEALNHVMHDRTVLAIAHRLSTIKQADLIVVMDQGRIVEQGTHQELYAQNGIYRTLHDMQFAEPT